MKLTTAKVFFSILKSRELILALMMLSCIWPLQFISRLTFPAAFTSVDASWMLSLGNAWAEQKIWGEEIIFTYGPLSFLSTRVMINSSTWPLFLFDFYFAFSFIYILYKILCTSFSLRRSALILITCFFYKQAMLLSLVFTLQLIVILYLNQYRKERNWLFVFQAIVLTSLIFYIKLNMAFVSCVIFILYIIYLNRLKELTLRYALLAVAALSAAIILGSYALPVHLLTYITTGFELILSYSDAVYIYPETFLEKALSGIILAVVFIGVAFVLKELKYHPPAHRWISGIFILLLFVLFKQSYVRADLEHLKDFFYCAPPCILVFIYVSKSKLEFIQFPILLLWFVSVGLTISFGDYFYPFKKVIAFPAYVYSCFQQPDYYEQAANRTLPEHIKKDIDSAPVDIIPWESSLLILNKLNYQPRPVIQSYQAYNETLDKINEIWYWENTAPDYVFYSLNSIDRHYHFFDDTYLKKALYCHYYIADTFSCKNEKMILFEKMDVRKQKSFVKIASVRKSINDLVIVPQSQYPLLVKIKMTYSLFGEFQKIILRAPYSEIKLEAEDSTSNTYQTAISILEGGILVSDFIRDEQDAVDFFSRTKKHKNRIKQFQLHIGNRSCWKDTVEYEWYELR